MKDYRPRYTPEAAARIRKLHPQVKTELRAAIRRILASPLSGRALQLELSGYWSYRVRTYRVVYRINDEAASLDIVFAGPRRSVYEELRALLEAQRRGGG